MPPPPRYSSRAGEERDSHPREWGNRSSSSFPIRRRGMVRPSNSSNSIPNRHSMLISSTPNNISRYSSINDSSKNTKWKWQPRNECRTPSDFRRRSGCSRRRRIITSSSSIVCIRRCGIVPSRIRVSSSRRNRLPFRRDQGLGVSLERSIRGDRPSRTNKPTNPQWTPRGGMPWGLRWGTTTCPRCTSRRRLPRWRGREQGIPWGTAWGGSTRARPRRWHGNVPRSRRCWRNGSRRSRPWRREEDRDSRRRGWGHLSKEQWGNNNKGA
mmetsp:Transcript_27301/g.50311  ORF Transcript_27301/g.50311 Transcript_27301/m.50311 type:complete len:268 (+) Transcript_27301:1774-2577(+)